MRHIDIPRDFSRHPAGRYLDDGPYNGELFRNRFLEPYIRKHEHIEINLDGVRGYGSSFLEEAFGGLVRLGFSADEILRLITFKSSNPVLLSQIKNYIREGLSRNARERNRAR
ncbi:hypothetical protein D9M69_443920 [compost metagenome]